MYSFPLSSQTRLPCPERRMISALVLPSPPAGMYCRALSTSSSSCSLLVCISFFPPDGEEPLAAGLFSDAGASGGARHASHESQRLRRR